MNVYNDGTSYAGVATSVTPAQADAQDGSVSRRRVAVRGRHWRSTAASRKSAMTPNSRSSPVRHYKESHDGQTVSKSTVNMIHMVGEIDTMQAIRTAIGL